MKRLPKSRTFVAARPQLAVLILALAAALPVHALDYSWSGGSGNWQDASKWSLGAVPGNGDRVFIDGGPITQDNNVTIGQLVFTSGGLQGAGTVTVTGSSLFDGTQMQSVSNPQGLTLLGDASWTVGNGTIRVSPASSSGSSTTPTAVFTIGAGTTFTDAGAASASSEKWLSGAPGGGTVQNNGSYVRNGLGLTWARNFQNAGLLDVRSGTFALSGGSVSTGTINVAAGSTLELDQFSGDVQIASGSINNLGRVLVSPSTGVGGVISSTATLNGAVELQGTLQVDGNNSLSSLLINDGGLGGAGTTTTATLNFVSGSLGLTNAVGGRTIVTGAATFDGTQAQSVTNGHTLELRGNASWTAGNGTLRVTPASGSTGAALLVIGTGTTFSDAGAASASGTKEVGYYGGNAVNKGTYNRDGLGETYAPRFDNRGVLNIRSGTFSTDTGFVNTGTITISAGAKLLGSSFGLSNQGVLQGTGTVELTDNNTRLFSNFGTLRPGEAGSIGTLTVDAKAALLGGSTLDIDLLSPASHDLLAITDNAQLGGTLLIHGLAGFAPSVGDSYMIATFAQGTGSFDSLVWAGPGDVQFALDYGSDEVTLRVTGVTTVPEPATALSLMLGLGLVAWRRTARMNRNV